MATRTDSIPPCIAHNKPDLSAKCQWFPAVNGWEETKHARPIIPLRGAQNRISMPSTWPLPLISTNPNFPCKGDPLPPTFSRWLQACGQRCGDGSVFFVKKKKELHVYHDRVRSKQRNSDRYSDRSSVELAQAMKNWGNDLDILYIFSIYLKSKIWHIWDSCFAKYAWQLASLHWFKIFFLRNV